VVSKPVNYSTGNPTVIKKTYHLAQLYSLLTDNTEDGVEGPYTWSKATHQWNKIPTYTPHLIFGVYNYANATELMGARYGLKVCYNCELSERIPYNSST
jgi:hypothetical protein